MTTNCNNLYNSTLRYLLLILLFIKTGLISNAQKKDFENRINSFVAAGSENHKDLFGTNGRYIQNIGQYGDTLPRFSRMGKILYGYEGLGMPVLFTQKGIIHLQRKTTKLSYEEREKLERQGVKKNEIQKRTVSVERVISLEWVNANPATNIIAEDTAQGYHVYGLLKKKAVAFKKITCKNIYPGIDIVYSFTTAAKPGYEYSFIIQPGADISRIKMKYAGDVASVTQDKKGNLIIKSDIDGMQHSIPLCFYSDDGTVTEKFTASYSVNKNTVDFKLPASYSASRSLVIDPFVTSTTNLTGTNSGIAKDIDFDYAGNVYVSGGGNSSAQNLAKFDAAGVLQWTFSGVLTTPVWNFGSAYGGWVVEKTTGNTYLGQGLPSGGFTVVRLDAAGIYDNYITTPNNSFGENWRMIWSCNGGTPKMLIAGGGGSANNELALLAPPSVVPATSNISGLTGGHNDISDIVIDPVTNDMYTIFSTSVLTPSADNIIYKHPPPYTSANITWQAPTGFFALREPANRPYLSGLDNSSNTLAVNAQYLFYWDGKNLKAFNKATGAAAGATYTDALSTKLLQGGIFADECNNVFVGYTNGTIKTYRFNGATFDDAAVADIAINGFSGSAVYDMVYDNARELLYVSGNGFVAAVDVSASCPSTVYNMSVLPDCVNLTGTATISPVPPAGTTITYVLFNGATQIATNSTGIFTGLTVGVNYTVKAFLNRACGGTQVIKDFVVTNPPTVTINHPGPQCVPGTVDLTAAAVTAGSSPGLAYSYWTDAAVSIPYTSPAAATAGTYYIKGTTVAGCFDIKSVVITAFPVPVANAGADIDICFGENTQLNASGGTAYAWSPSTYLDNPSVANPKVIKPAAGIYVYHLVVTDANGCKSLTDEQVTVTVPAPAKLFIGNDTAIAFNQPLQLNATDVNNSGFVNFVWSPAIGLSNAFIRNPVAILDRDIVYSLTAATAGNCNATAYIRVKVYQGPEIYVPKAFTPGNDGLNDILKAIVVGMKEFHYFSVYNRYGNLMFTTKDHRKGWDGKISGTAQGSGAYVWIAEAVDYKGNLVRRKGTVVLIR